MVLNLTSHEPRKRGVDHFRGVGKNHHIINYMVKGKIDSNLLDIQIFVLNMFVLSL